MIDGRTTSRTPTHYKNKSLWSLFSPAQWFPRELQLAPVQSVVRHEMFPTYPPTMPIAYNAHEVECPERPSSRCLGSIIPFFPSHCIEKHSLLYFSTTKKIVYCLMWMQDPGCPKPPQLGLRRMVGRIGFPLRYETNKHSHLACFPVW